MTEECKAAASALRAALAEQERTGWPPGLLQDDSRDLSRWLAGKPDAMQRAREVLHADPTDPGHDVGVLREHVRHLERRVRELAPPQRQPLSAIDLRALYDRHAACQEEGPEISGWWDFARAIERAHGIKGQA
jgi:hypothetical protein